MKKEIKLENQSPIDLSKFEDFIKAFHKAAEDAGLTYDIALVKRFVCALLAKPFVVLTGLSGSGKTKLAHSPNGSPSRTPLVSSRLAQTGRTTRSCSAIRMGLTRTTMSSRTRAS